MVRRGRIRRGRVVVARTLIFCAVTLAVIALAPVIVLVGEPLRRHYLRRLSGPPRRVLERVVIANPVLIALTAPSRWAIDRVGGLRAGGSGGRGFGRFGRRGGQGDGGWPPSAGVREPRRPKPNAPAGAIALAEPRQQHRAIPILKALPPSLSEPARRVGSRLGRMAAVLRLRFSERHPGQ
jgi:hypothetical protein